MKKKDIAKTIFICIGFGFILSIISHGIEEGLLWGMAGEIVDSGGHQNMIEVAELIVHSPQFLLWRFFLRMLCYGITTGLVLYRIQDTFFYPLFVTVINFLLTLFLSWIKNVQDFSGYFSLYLIELTLALFITTVIIVVYDVYRHDRGRHGLSGGTGSLPADVRSTRGNRQ